MELRHGKRGEFASEKCAEMIWWTAFNVDKKLSNIWWCWCHIKSETMLKAKGEIPSTAWCFLVTVVLYFYWKKENKADLVTVGKSKWIYFSGVFTSMWRAVWIHLKSLIFMSWAIQIIHLFCFGPIGLSVCFKYLRHKQMKINMQSCLGGVWLTVCEGSRCSGANNSLWRDRGKMLWPHLL